MRRPRVLAKVGLTLTITAVFLAVSLLPRLTPSAYADSAAPPMPVPEDPMGQQPEQQPPEVSVSVDARDGHMTARVVDIWGPGRTPFVVRSFTNTQSTSISASGVTTGYWQFNHLLDVVGLGTDSQGRALLGVREPDGNRAVYKSSTTRWSGDQSEKWDVYVKNVGTYSTLEMHYTCVPGLPGGGNTPTPRPSPSPTRRSQLQPPPGAGARIGTVAGPEQTHGTPAPVPPQDPSRVWLLAAPDCTWDGTYVVYLPKGVSRRFAQNPDPTQGAGPLPGLITQESDANDNVTTFTWTTFPDQIQAYIATVRDPVGRVTTYAYEHASSVCMNELCTVVKWYYRVKTVTDPWGRTATYTYVAPGLLASAVNAAGRTTSYTYTGGGTYFGLTGVTNARGFATTMQWGGSEVLGDTSLRVTRVTAPDGTSTSYAYTVSFDTKQPSRTVVTNARNYATTYDLYNGLDENYFGNVQVVTDPLGNVTQYTYDGLHNVTQATDARGNRTTYAYNTHNKVTQVVKAAGTLNLTTTATWDSNDNQLSLTNPRGILTNYKYDSKNNLTGARKAVGTADESYTQYTYNAWGGVASVIDPRGNTTSYAYTARHQVQVVTPPVGGTTSFTYNSFDDQITKTDGNSHAWTTAYDTSRLVTSVTDPLTNQVRFVYDTNGNRTQTYDAKNQLTTFTYDNRDRLTNITEPLNGQTQYAYDAVSNLTRITNARNVIAATSTYDADNRLTQVQDALGRSTTYQYDAVGNRTQMTDRKGQITTFTYDQANRLTQTGAGGQTISYTYDANGNRLTLVDPTGTTSYTYDNLDRLTRATYPDTRTVQATYDRASNRTSLTNPGGTATTATYDVANRLTQMTQGSLTWTFGYDAAGNRTSLGHPNGTSIAYAYLNNNWLSSITHRAPSGTTFQTFAYTYDANGNRLTQADSSGTTTFTYDALNRLTQAAYPAGYGTYSWTYDAVGDRLTQTAPSGTTNYTYDNNNRLLTAGSTSYAYDNNGNLLSISTGRTFAWDVFNRLTSTTASGSTVTYTYNGDGLKTRRVGPNGTTNYYYDGIRPIWETNSAGAMTAQYDRDIFGNLLSRLETGNIRRYYHFDGLGSTTALTDTVGAVAGTLLYDAWGNVRTSSGTGQGNYRFTGAELDTSTGLYHMGARFYDPTIGRWLSEDPVQDKPFEPATLNFYNYASNNPVLFIDPRGTEHEGVGGGTPTDPRTAAEKLQDEINARLEMEQLIESLMSRGYTRLGVALRNVLGIIDVVPSALSTLSTELMAQLAKALYIESTVFFGMGVFLETVAALTALMTRDWKHIAVNPLIDLGVGLLVLGAYIDTFCCGGRVLTDYVGSLRIGSERRRRGPP